MSPTRAVQNGDDRSYDVLWGMHVKIVVGVSIVLTAAAATASVAAFIRQAVIMNRLATAESALYGHLAELEGIKEKFVRKDAFDSHDHHGTAAPQGALPYAIETTKRRPR